MTLEEITLKHLSDIDPLVTGPWTTPITWRQPIHTVYIPADKVSPTSHREWGDAALETLSTLDPTVEMDLDPLVGELMRAKLRREPVEDLRIDFEDGFTGSPGAEDELADRAGEILAGWLTNGDAPPFCGIRFKSFDPVTRARGLRTLERVLALLNGVDASPRALRLTLPKVQHHQQVAALVAVLDALGFPGLGFEVQVEAPQAIIGPGGAVEPGRILEAGQGRILSLHYGTYDYSASLGVDAAEQAMDHPVADFAKDILQVATARLGVELSDGSTNRLPVGDTEQMLDGWRTHFRLVSRQLRRGIRQGWDLHPNQLITRHLATIAYFRESWDVTAHRLRAYAEGEDSRWLDEPATARAMAGYLLRALACSAISDHELAATGLAEPQLQQLRRTGRMT